MIRNPLNFRPLPLLGNGHVQTLLGTLLHGSTPLPTVERQVTLSDGDRLVLHDSVPPTWQPGGRISLLVHGLSGSHASGYMERVASQLLAHGVRAVRLDLRGAGRGMALARGTYNGACSEDVRAALAELHVLAPQSPLLVVGFSLGGNIVLKLAGEAAKRPVPQLARVAAVNAPIDLIRCSELLSKPQNRLYELHFVHELIKQMRQRQRHFPDLELPAFSRRMTVRQFDDVYTAPRGGFADALDYYRKAASLPLIPYIPVPTLLLTARDDPFVAVEPFETLMAPPHIEIQILPRGGHLGYLGWEGGVVRWAERRVVQWLTQAD